MLYWNEQIHSYVWSHMSHLTCNPVLKARLRKWTDCDDSGASLNFVVERAKNGCLLSAWLSASLRPCDTTLHLFDYARLHLHFLFHLATTSGAVDAAVQRQRLHKTQVRRKIGHAQKRNCTANVHSYQSHSQQRNDTYIFINSEEVMCGGFSGEAVQIQG